MAKRPAEKVTALKHVDEAGHLIGVATLSRIEDDGAVFINDPENRSHPVRAQLSLCEADQDRLRSSRDAPRLLVLHSENAVTMPVVIGLISDTLAQEAPPDENETEDHVHLDVSALKLEAKTELVLHCGKSQITMKADGRIILRGTDVISRSSGPNRIRGATVRIN